jgi:hypothetical protein
MATMDPNAHIGAFATHAFDCFTFFVNMRFFLDVVESLSPSIEHTGIGESTAVAFIPWENWGPKNTRWFRDSLSKNWQHAIFGLRTVESISDGGSVAELDYEKYRLRVRDFNPNAVRMAASCQQVVDEQGGRIIIEPSILPAADVFMYDIESSLPFREIVTTELVDVTEVMMDECRILLLKVSHQHDSFLKY